MKQLIKIWYKDGTYKYSYALGHTLKQIKDFIDELSMIDEIEGVEIICEEEEKEELEQAAVEDHAITVKSC